MNGRRGNTIHIPRGYYSSAQIAALVDVSADTVKRWRDVGACRPAKTMKAGRLKVFLYDGQGLAKARALAGRKTRDLDSVEADELAA